MNTAVQHDRETCTEGLACPKCWPQTDPLKDMRLNVETKAEKLARLQREIREFRIETLQDAARILEQLDEKIIGPYGNAQLVSIEFLKRVSEKIRKEP